MYGGKSLRRSQRAARPVSDIGDVILVSPSYVGHAEASSSGRSDSAG